MRGRLIGFFAITAAGVLSGTVAQSADIETSVCEAAKVPFAQEGKVVTIAATVLSTGMEYPDFLKDPSCPDLSVRLQIEPASANEDSVQSFIQAVIQEPRGTAEKDISAKFTGIVRLYQSGGPKYPVLILKSVSDLAITLKK